MKTVTVTVTEDGEVAIDLQGFHGQGCARVMADFSDGDRLKVERNKPEFRETVGEKERQKA
jgi:hypothetical protein